jgi:hypothetical protein
VQTPPTERLSLPPADRHRPRPQAPDST